MTSTKATLLPRAIKQAFLATQQSEGVGAKVRRSIGTRSLRNFSPFLMLDHFSVQPGAGFPDHPHRGQETITYMLSGSSEHEDFAGNRGKLLPGWLQFMTAGRGIVHSEMPTQEGCVGLQLWVDLPKDLKMTEPRYRDLGPEEIPTVKLDEGKVEVKVISGEGPEGTKSVQELAYTPVWLLDVTIKPGGSLSQPLPKEWNAFAYTLEGGSVSFGAPDNDDTTTVGPYHNVVFEQGAGEGVHASVAEDEKETGRFVIVAGQPLDQKVVQYGPFVMNTQDEVYQAMLDYQSNSNGFERAKGWRSEIGKAMAH